MPRTHEIPRPFLKWAGGKGQLLPALRARAPERWGRYHEPFLGGGALFFALKPAQAVLSDVNPRLVRTWRGVQSQVEDVIALLQGYPHDQDFYYQMRERDIDEASDAEVAAWMIYLNKTGFNGLYRVNSKGGFNVPFGRYTNPTICDAPNLRACSELLKRAEILLAPFTQVEQRAQASDFVYFDPPYVPLSASSSFTSYTRDGFDLEDQAALRDLALRLKAAGVHVLLSNSSAPPVYELYASGFEREEVLATRSINSKADSRGSIPELLMW